jgi:hypothetical protein
MMIQQVSNYFKLKRMQYELLTGLGMLLPWEKAIICKSYMTSKVNAQKRIPTQHLRLIRSVSALITN